MRDNYIFSTFIGAPQSILGGIFLFLVAVVIGQGGLILALALTHEGSWGTDSVVNFLLSLVVVFFYGAASGVGLIFLAVDFWIIYRLICQDESALNFFFVIAASQVGLFLSATIPMGEFWDGLPAGAVILVVLGLVYWGANKLKKKLLERQLAEIEAP